MFFFAISKRFFLFQIFIDKRNLNSTMKRDFTKDFKEIQTMCNRVRGINESVAYDDEDDYGMDDMQYQGQSKQQPEEEPFSGDKSDEELAAGTPEGFEMLNTIREMCLKGMVKLCNSPEDPVYTSLKKIFSFAEKAITEKDGSED